MLKIFNSKQIKELDAYTIKNEPIASIDLMERACRAFVNWYGENFDTTKKIGVVCGTGNNGGDGLGIARLLIDRGYTVKVWIVRGSVLETPDFKTNLDRLNGKADVFEIITSSDQGLFHDMQVIIDAVFGVGLSRPLDGIYSQAISCMNQTNAIRLAIDMPSGLLPDNHSEGIVLKAHKTISFQLPKLAFFLPENYKYTGDWHVVNIGLDKSFIEKTETSQFLLERKDILQCKKIRSKFDHKGTYGKALLIAGSYGKVGSAVLGARAAMRSGLGLLTTHVPQCGYTIMQTAIPESMVSIDPHDKILTTVTQLENYDAIGIGPGLGSAAETIKAFSSILEKVTKSMVIDADGLNILSSNPKLFTLIPEGSLLTPHPKEFERLVGTWRNDVERLEKLRAFASRTKTNIILKGAYTSIAAIDGSVYFNPTGNPGMATGGSGDVLTGILTGLLAQDYSPIDAAKIGVYLHGLAGDLAVDQLGMEALVASDLIDFLPSAFQSLKLN